MQPEQQHAQGAEPRYCIDLQWLDRVNRSFQVLVSTRFCPKHQSEISSLFSKSSSSRGETRVFRAFKDCCSRERKDFFHPNMPVFEALFNLLLAKGNEPTTAEELSDRLVELGLDSNGLRDVSPEVVRRLIEHDDWYGLNRVPES